MNYCAPICSATAPKNIASCQSERTATDCNNENYSSAGGIETYILPPPPIQNIPVWKIQLARYTAAYREHDLALSSRQPVDPKIVEEYTSSRTELLGATRQLFSAAFINENYCGAKETWVEFANAVQATEPFEYDYDLKFYLALSQPALAAADRKLLFDYKGNEADQAATNALNERVMARWHSRANNYNSWRQPKAPTAEKAFFNALDELISYHSQDLIGKNYQQFLVAMSPQEAKWYLGLSKSGFEKECELAQDEFQRFPAGTANRNRLRIKLFDLEVIGYARAYSKSVDDGFDSEEQIHEIGLSERPLFRRVSLYQQLDSTIYTRLYHFKRLASAGNAKISVQDREDFIAFLNQVEDHYRTLSPTKAQARIISTVLVELYEMANCFGCDGNQLAKNFNASRPDPPGKIRRYRDLQKISQPVAVAPDGLPPEVMKIIKDSGYYDLVKANVKEIVFTPDIVGSDHVSGEVGGYADSILGRVVIDTSSDREKQRRPVFLAEIVIHEAGHIARRRTQTEEPFDQITTEDNSYYMGYQFFEKYLKQEIAAGRIDPQSAEAAEIAEGMFRSLYASKAVARYFGRVDGRLNPEKWIPPTIEHLNLLGLASIDELRSDEYPMDMLKIDLENRYSGLIERLRTFGQIDESALKIVEQIMSGAVRLEISRYLPESDDDNNPRMRFSLRSADGKSTPLNDKEKRGMLDFFALIDKVVTAGRRSISKGDKGPAILGFMGKPEIQKDHDFALYRLSSADMYDIFVGLMCYFDGRDYLAMNYDRH